VDINDVVWSFLIVFMLHNFEEILTIEKWFKNTFPTIRNQIPTLVKKELEKEEKITSGQFSIAVCVLFIISSVLILLTVIQGYYFLFIGLNIFFALNIFTHPIQSIFLKKYVPGLWTTILLIIPYNVLVFYQLYIHDFLQAKTIISAFFITILLIPALLFSHKIAKKWG